MRRAREHAIAYGISAPVVQEIAPDGSLLGNHPQGFTHLGLIHAALHIAEAIHATQPRRAG